MEEPGLREQEEEEEEEEERADPRSLKPDLYAAAVQNDTAKVLELLAVNVPATYVDDASGWTVRVVRFTAFAPSSAPTLPPSAFLTSPHLLISSSPHLMSLHQTALALGGQVRQHRAPEPHD